MSVLKNYLSVAKPVIVIGNVITAGAGFFLASRGHHDAGLLLPAISGIALIIASACVLNNCIDRDIDRKMLRTCSRAIPRGLISPGASIVYASLLGIAGIGLLTIAWTVLSLVITLSGFVIYVGLYSLRLKRNSSYAVLVGSLAGAAPPLAGYCAVTKGFDLAALILLAIFTLWQIPHTYAIAILRSGDYAAASIPVPATGRYLSSPKRRLACFIVPFAIAGPMLTLAGFTGYGYLAVAVALGFFWIPVALLGFGSSDDRVWAKRQLAFSLFSIFALSIAMAA
jgi:heme o synthase